MPSIALKSQHAAPIPMWEVYNDFYKPAIQAQLGKVLTLLMKAGGHVGEPKSLKDPNRPDKVTHAARTKRRDECVAYMRANPEAGNKEVAVKFGYDAGTVCALRRQFGIPGVIPAKERYKNLIAANPEMTKAEAARQVGISYKTAQVYHSELFGAEKVKLSDGEELKAKRHGKWG